jgi:hypothetical protein
MEYVCVEEVLVSHKRLDVHTTKEGLTFFLKRSPQRGSLFSTKAPVEAVIPSQGWGELHNTRRLPTPYGASTTPS